MTRSRQTVKERTLRARPDCTQHGGSDPDQPFHGGRTVLPGNLVTSVRKGIYVTRFHYTTWFEPMKTVITGMTRDGTFLIEGGRSKLRSKT